MLLAYSKMSLDQELVASDLPDTPELLADMRDYFPPQLRERFAAQITAHPLCREIIATVVTNDLVNRAGITFVSDLRARTGRTAPEIARVYRIVRDVFQLPPLWAAIEALDNKVAASVQSEMLLDIASVIEHAAGWLLRSGRTDIAAETERLAPGVRELAGHLAELLPAGERVLFDRRTDRFAASGVPPALAVQVAGIVFLTTAFEIGDLANRTAQPIERAARSFYDIGARLALDEMRGAARRLPVETSWQRAAVESVIDDLYSMQAELAERILKTADGAEDPVTTWAASRAAVLAPAEAVAAELRAAPTPDLAMLVVAARQLRLSLTAS